MKFIWFSIAKLASDAYLNREDVARWEIWLGRYIFVVALAVLVYELIDLPFIALIVFAAMAFIGIAIVLLHSMFLFTLNGDPFWIAVWYAFKYTGIHWLYWKLIFERRVEDDHSKIVGLKENERFTHRGKDWVLLTSGGSTPRFAIVQVERGQDVFIPEPVPVVAGEDESCST
jgi:hypothetical protein